MGVHRCAAGIFQSRQIQFMMALCCMNFRLNLLQVWAWGGDNRFNARADIGNDTTHWEFAPASTEIYVYE